MPKNINKLVKDLFEFEVPPPGLFRARNAENKIRSPELAYKVVYGKLPPKFMRGRSDDPKRMWNNIPVDEELKDDWLNSLNQIKGITIRASCAGHSPERVAYVVFRPDRQDEKYCKKVVSKLQQCKNTKAGYDIGNRGMFRICVATKNWFGKTRDNKSWYDWWDNLANCIQRAVR